MTPRQRIAVTREISRLKKSANGLGHFQEKKILRELQNAYAYSGEATCAADGVCSVACPVGIDTGRLALETRTLQRGFFSKSLAHLVSKHFALVNLFARLGLRLIPQLPGPSAIPKSFGKNPKRDVESISNKRKVIYFSSCMSRTLGGNSSEDSTPSAVINILQKAGFEIHYPQNPWSLCCGKAFESKGFSKAATGKAEKTLRALGAASQNGNIPVLIDTSPCAQSLIALANKTNFKNIWDPVSFAKTHLLPNLALKPTNEGEAIHITCSDRKMGLEKTWREIVKALAPNAIFPTGSDCCGFAGDLGFTHPELLKSSLRFLKSELVEKTKSGFSSSRACEIGLTRESGKEYRSLFHLINQTTVPKE